MSVLIIKNIAGEGPGTIADYLGERGMPYEIVELYDCKAEIPDVRNYSHLVVMGGPMAVYEMDEHAFLSYESAIIRAFIKYKKPVLGICLGAQMVADALRGKVYKGEIQELGWSDVDISDAGMKDPVFSSLSVDNRPVAEVFQWHGDTFGLPENAVRMASSKPYENQAFRYGECVYALQFHIEITPAMIREWFADRAGSDIDRMIARTEGVYPEYQKRAVQFYERFFSLNCSSTQ